MALYVKTGTYTGNGSGVNRAITGIGFQPKMLIIRAAGVPATSVNAVMVIDAFPAGYSQRMGGTSVSAYTDVISLDSDGFTVKNIGTQYGTNVNAVVYHYLCVGGTSSSIESGSYTGNGTDNRDVVTGLSFEPGFVYIKRLSTQLESMATDTMAGNSVRFSGGAIAGNEIQALNSDGFQVGTSSRVNASSTTYYWLAIKKEASGVSTGSYTGTGSAGLNVTSAAFEPLFAIVFPIGTSYGYIRQDTMTTTSSAPSTGTTWNANGITAMLSNGFTVGSSANINTNTSTYYYLAFKEPDPGVDINISDTFVLSDSVKKTAGKNFSETLSLADSLATLKSITKSISDSINLSDTVSRVTAKVFAETINLSDSITRTLSKILSDTLSLADSIANIKVTLIAISDSINLADSFGRGIAKVMSDTVALAEDFMATATKVFTDTISLADSAVALSVRFVEFIDTITLSDIMNKSNFLRVMDTILLVDEFRNRSWTRRIKPAEGTWTPRTKPPA